MKDNNKNLNNKNLNNALNDDEMESVAGGETKFGYWNPKQRKALDSFYGNSRGDRLHAHWMRREFDPAGAVSVLRSRLQENRDNCFTAEQIDKLEKDLGLS